MKDCRSDADFTKVVFDGCHNYFHVVKLRNCVIGQLVAHWQSCFLALTAVWLVPGFALSTINVPTLFQSDTFFDFFHTVVAAECISNCLQGCLELCHTFADQLKLLFYLLPLVLVFQSLKLLLQAFYLVFSFLLNFLFNQVDLWHLFVEHCNHLFIGFILFLESQLLFFECLFGSRYHTLEFFVAVLVELEFAFDLVVVLAHLLHLFRFLLQDLLQLSAVAAFVFLQI